MKPQAESKQTRTHTHTHSLTVHSGGYEYFTGPSAVGQVTDMASRYRLHWWSLADTRLQMFAD